MSEFKMHLFATNIDRRKFWIGISEEFKNYFEIYLIINKIFMLITKHVYKFIHFTILSWQKWEIFKQNKTIFNTLKSLFVKFLWIRFIWYSVRTLTNVNFFVFLCNWYMLLMFTVEISRKRKSVSFIFHLKGHAKIFRYFLFHMGWKIVCDSF